MYKSMNDHIDASTVALAQLEKIMPHDTAVFVFEAIDHATRCKDYIEMYGELGKHALQSLQDSWLKKHAIK